MFKEKVRRTASFAILAILLLGTLIFAGCGTDENSGQADANPNAALSGTINIAGSTSVQPFSEVLAEEFMKLHKDVQINVQGGGSSQGVTAVVSGVADIGAASRELKEEEIAEGVAPIKMAIDGIAIVVHPDNSIGDLSADQVKSIYTGNVTNWKEVGGADATITVVTREESSGTRDAFLDIIMAKEEITSSAIVQNSTGAVRTTVSGDPNAIGYISLASLNEEVKALDIDSVAASVENIKNGSYLLQRPFHYITTDKTSDLAQAFIDFTLSDEGQRIVEEEGAFSVN
ncbi:MAG: phosphate ABC transporter substrate-binding protein [Bacillota bacterium]|jgi:phosphate transport system substrate-binding protein|nr:phosphate ABC transporter substrate-binding protein [Bacillota bacterium]NLP25195.1 phosphate ABC transporter substrate-binding protein [Syntrophomonadaceae bacterium]NMB02561.1 phosphate ABC transporter substrate-binding protein [Bacillota bacterium]